MSREIIPPKIISICRENREIDGYHGVWDLSGPELETALNFLHLQVILQDPGPDKENHSQD